MYTPPISKTPVPPTTVTLRSHTCAQTFLLIPLVSHFEPHHPVTSAIEQLRHSQSTESFDYLKQTRKPVSLFSGLCIDPYRQHPSPLSAMLPPLCVFKSKITMPLRILYLDHVAQMSVLSRQYVPLFQPGTSSAAQPLGYSHSGVYRTS